MIRPCDQCGGSGDPFDSGWHEGPMRCPRCEGMPKLLVSREMEATVLFRHDVVEEVRRRGWFYPDPDSEGIAQVVEHDDTVHANMIWTDLAVGTWVWVKALEEAT